jgi:Zn-dependent protease with chaperone function
MRLNQLSFVDETALGLFVTAAIIIEDIRGRPHSWGQIVSQQVTPLAPPWLTAPGVLQLFVLMAVAGFLTWFQVRGTVRLLKPEPMSAGDVSFSKTVANVQAEFGATRARFVITPNALDANAVCLPWGIKVLVVLGGGLRIENRKLPRNAASVVGHECAHVLRNDVWLITVVWHLYVAYAALAAVDIIVQQAIFWPMFIKTIPGWSVAGVGVGGLLWINLPVILRNGLTALIQLTTIGLFMGVFIRWREYLADEFCAQKGYRESLTEQLEKIPEDRRFKWRNPFAIFHPTARSRVSRLKVEGWLRLDYIFCFACAAVVQFVTLSVDSPLIRLLRGFMNGGVSYSEFLTSGPQMVELISFSDILLLLSFSLTGFFAGAHFYRTAFSKYAAGYRFSYRAVDLCRAWLAGALGAIAGAFSDTPTLDAILNAMTTGTVGVAPTEMLKNNAALACSYMELVLSCYFVLLMMIPFAARFYGRNKWLRWGGFLLVYIFLWIPGQIVTNLLSSFVAWPFLLQVGNRLWLVPVTQSFMLAVVSVLLIAVQMLFSKGKNCKSATMRSINPARLAA